jgi:hypothetical protein
MNLPGVWQIVPIALPDAKNVRVREEVFILTPHCHFHIVAS